MNQLKIIESKSTNWCNFRELLFSFENNMELVSLYLLSPKKPHFYYMYCKTPYFCCQFITRFSNLGVISRVFIFSHILIFGHGKLGINVKIKTSQKLCFTVCLTIAILS